MELSGLELGCGNSQTELPGVKLTRLDASKLPHVGVVHNLEQFPWPFKKQRFDIILANHLLEHLDDFTRSLKEAFRVMKDDGLLVVRLPYQTSQCRWGCNPQTIF